MRTRVFSLALSFCLLAIGAATAASPGRLEPAPMPTVLFQSVESTRPIWVEATAAVDQAGRARADLFGDAAIGLQQTLDESATAGCLRFERADLMYAQPPLRDSLDDAVEHSRTRLLAKVTNRAFGIYSGVIPGQLLQVVPVRTFGEALPQKHYYFFVPVGDFRLGNREVCKTDTGYAAPPKVGSEVFLFIAGPPSGLDTNLLFVYGPGDVVPVARDGSLSLPRQYRLAEAAAKTTTARSKAELLDRLDRTLRQKVWR